MDFFTTVVTTTVADHALHRHVNMTYLDILTTRLIDKTTGQQEFHNTLGEVAQILFPFAMSHLPTVAMPVLSNATEPDGIYPDPDYAPLVISIERAGGAMVTGIEKIHPTMKTGKIRLARNHTTLEAEVNGHHELPDLDPGKIAFIHLDDPMLATGNSAVAAIELLMRRYPGCKIVFTCVFAAREGLAKLATEQPDVPVYTAFVSAYKLDERGYIQDGPGDAGDRAFGEKSEAEHKLVPTMSEEPGAPIAAAEAA